MILIHEEERTISSSTSTFLKFKHHCQKKSPQKPELIINAEELANYADIAARTTVERAETEKVRRAVRTIGEIFISRANMTTRLLAEFTGKYKIVGVIYG